MPQRLAGDRVEHVGVRRPNGDPQEVPGPDRGPCGQERVERGARGSAPGQLNARGGHRRSADGQRDDGVPSGELGVGHQGVQSHGLRIRTVRRVAHVLRPQAQHDLAADVTAQRRRDRPPQRQRPRAHDEARVPTRGDQSGGEQPDGRRADESGREQVPRPVVELPRPADLHEDALVQQGHPVGDREPLRLVVGDVDRRNAQPAHEIDDLPAHRGPLRRVEARQRLVEQEHVGRLDQRAAEAGQPTLTAGQRGRQAGQEPAQPQVTGPAGDPLLDVRFRQPPRAQAPSEVARHVEERDQRGRLEDHRDPPPVGRYPGDRAAPDHHVAGVDLVETGQHPQQRGLAAARRAEHHQELALTGSQGDVPEHRGAVPDHAHVLPPRTAHPFRPPTRPPPRLLTSVPKFAGVFCLGEVYCERKARYSAVVTRG